MPFPRFRNGCVRGSTSPVTCPPTVLVQACQHLGLVLIDEVYQHFTFVLHTPNRKLRSTLMLAEMKSSHESFSGDLVSRASHPVWQYHTTHYRIANP
jgi:hypothetical protein